MWEKFASLFRVPELRKRILFTLGAIIVFRLGSFITVPGVDKSVLQQVFNSGSGGIWDWMNMFSGGALQRFSLFALGVAPYINASIIFSLLVSVVPKLKELQQQGREGQRKITTYTRWATVALAVLQAAFTIAVIQQAVSNPGILFYVTTIVALTAGTMFLMWLGERITENGIGNGISMLIMIGILSRFPANIGQMVSDISNDPVRLGIWGVVFVVLLVVMVAAMTIIQQGQRKIQIQYAKRTMGRRIYGGHTSHLPLRVNQGGVIPIIFASALLSLPVTLFQAIPGLTQYLYLIESGSPLYMGLYVLLIFFFTYFYSSIVFDPTEMAKNIREAGGFIPGVRPGDPTSEYVTGIMNRLLLIGAVFLSVVAILPYILYQASGIASMFLIGGTSLLIVVGVGIDTIMQIEAHLVMRHYESLTKSGRLLGRRS